jgi:4-hydroxy-3-polyprenylbenzoate decarboxylase
MRSLPIFRDLRSFLLHAEGQGDLARIADPVDLRHEMTAVKLAALRARGPVLHFDAARHGDQRATMPVIANLFGTPARVAAGLGLSLDQVPAFGDFLAALRNPAPVEGMRDALSRWPVLRAALQSRPKLLRRGPAQEVSAPLDLSLIPVQIPWPGDAGPLITWPVVMTRPHGSDAGQVALYSLGVYRAQVLGPDRLILRWLAHRGGAAHHRSWARAGKPMPVAIALGADPATLLSAALPLPETVSELSFSGVLRGARAELVAAKTVPLLVPAHARSYWRVGSTPARPRQRGPSATIPATTTRSSPSR